MSFNRQIDVQNKAQNNVQTDVQRAVQQALQEDLPNGDITTDCFNLSHVMGRARLIAKEDLVLSGVMPFTLAFHGLNPNIQIQWHFQPGQFVLREQTIGLLTGSLSSLLSAERVALNFLGRLSGIATLTHCFVKQVQHTKCKILDTRKTTPGLRALEKAAVIDGGGTNHRMNLSHAILVKENHIFSMGGIAQTLTHLQRLKVDSIEIEVRNLEELRQVLQYKVDRILLDNMSDAEISEAVKLIPASIQSEASGSMTLERVKAVAELGVDFISVGALTHSAPCADVSLLFE